jgi:large subunit ribosomal protein L25
MSEKLEIHAELRTEVGKGASRRLRRLGNQVPGIIYGGNSDPINLKLDRNELSRNMLTETFFSQILNVIVDGNSEQALVRDLQRNPIDDKVVHVDFLRIRADMVLHVSVPLHFVNQDKCVGVRQGGGNISHAMNDVEISCLPKYLPEFIEVYMAELDLNETIHLSDLAMPEGVSLVALEHGDDRNVVSVLQPRGGADADEEAAEAEDAAAAAEAGADEADAAGEPSED